LKGEKSGYFRERERKKERGKKTMMRRRVVVVSAAVSAFLFTPASASTPLLPVLTCSLHPGGLGERQEVGCVLSGAVLSTGEGALLLVHLPPGIGPDNAWLAGAAVAGSGGVVACGASDAPLQGSGVPGCPALLQGNNASTSLAACLPPSATAHPARFYLRTPLPAACTDEGIAARAQPALLAVAAAAAAGDNGAVAFNSFALRARLPAPLPSSWLGGSVTVSLPPPVLVAVARGGAARVVAVATATTGVGTQWVVPAPGGKGAGVVGLVTAGAVLGSTALMVGAVVRERTLTATKAA